jgi:hypothetical protein
VSRYKEKGQKDRNKEKKKHKEKGGKPLSLLVLPPTWAIDLGHKEKNYCTNSDQRE